MSKNFACLAQNVALLALACLAPVRCLAAHIRRDGSAGIQRGTLAHAPPDILVYSHVAPPRFPFFPRKAREARQAGGLPGTRERRFSQVRAGPGPCVLYCIGDARPDDKGRAQTAERGGTPTVAAPSRIVGVTRCTCDALFDKEMNLEPMNLPAVEAQSGPGLARFAGTRAPIYEVVTEKPWHRSAAFMFARGATSQEVALNLEVAPSTVSNLLRQPWFQDRVTQLMAEYGGRDVIELFKAEAFNSLVTLVELRDTAKSETVRKSSATEILDRALGKPLQRVESSTVPRSMDPAAEVAALERENMLLSGGSPSPEQ